MVHHRIRINPIFTSIANYTNHTMPPHLCELSAGTAISNAAPKYACCDFTSFHVTAEPATSTDSTVSSFVSSSCTNRHKSRPRMSSGNHTTVLPVTSVSTAHEQAQLYRLAYGTSVVNEKLQLIGHYVHLPCSYRWFPHMMDLLALSEP